jgi:hypothetical protein
MLILGGLSADVVTLFQNPSLLWGLPATTATFAVQPVIY